MMYNNDRNCSGLQYRPAWIPYSGSISLSRGCRFVFRFFQDLRFGFSPVVPFDVWDASSGGRQAEQSPAYAKYALPGDLHTQAHFFGVTVRETIREEG
jgi:hypothetical protein